MPHIEERLKNKKYEPEGLTEKHLKRLPSLSNRFLLYKGRIYRSGVENQHRLYVPKDRRTYMMTMGHDNNQKQQGED